MNIMILVRVHSEALDIIFIVCLKTVVLKNKIKSVTCTYTYLKSFAFNAQHVCISFFFHLLFN